MNGAQQEGGASDPIGQGRAIEIDALPRIDLSLPVKRKMIGVFGDQNLRHSRLGGNAALDQASRRRRLHHHLLTAPAGIFGPADNQDPELGGDDVEPLGPIFADPMQGAAAARAGMALDIDEHLDTRQMGGKRSPVGAARRCSRSTLRGCILFRGSFAGGFDLVSLFEAKKQLVFGQRLGATAEAMTLQLLDDLFEPLGPRRSASTIALSVLGSSGSASAMTVMTKIEHGLRCAASRRMHLIHCVAAQLGCKGTMVSRGSCTRLQSSPSNRAESWAADRRITPSCTFGQRNSPSSSRLAKRQTPVPSQKTSFTRSVLFARNT
jgi:hypothetical protein